MRFVLNEDLMRAPNLMELEAHWNPKMSFARGDMSDWVVENIAEHKSLRVIRLGGNVPRAWIEELGLMPGKLVVVEPLMWAIRDLVEVEKKERMKERKIEKSRARVDAFHGSRLWLREWIWLDKRPRTRKNRFLDRSSSLMKSGVASRSTEEEVVLTLN